MKIDITKQEYRLLLDLLEIAHWVLDAHSTWDKEETKPYTALIQKIYSHAKEMGCADIIVYDKKLAAYFPTREYEEDGEHRQFIEAFEEDSFWDELSHKLAFRDLIQQEGEVALERMDFMERATKLTEFLSWYEEEFSDNGLTNVRVVKERSNKVN
uniref:Uncharacterized protein n=1 Tax=Candidatus Kentrum sp. FM TaxID=2126340 RepID=A0A450VXH8_9GAMM|nr:MAG: hypothetical protein BECKFM1743A_GA0114220_101044 [Candidatus Kentron sp. FM]VFJ70070.1 MAG: hypothetical protein BECKFM1743C_GA0114222_105415 [Candidatus Kentron sp. FM]VFK09523.1 MAG: hypothetical protein BECKFM1743B_GA0114221_101075 [Candidatus Kentron sp. FM]